MVRRMRTLNTVVVAALATAGIAAAAAGDVWPCHPDLPGTRSLTVTGQVTSYRFAGRGTLVASVKTRRCAGVARWNYAASADATASVACRGAKTGRSVEFSPLAKLGHRGVNSHRSEGVRHPSVIRPGGR